LKYLPEAKPEDMLCKQCKNTNSITHLIALCNHIKPLWQDLAMLYGEIAAIIPDEFKYSIKEEYFILIENLQLAIFICKLQPNKSKSNYAKPQSNSNAAKQIWHQQMLL
jgi:hypothetical protein